MKKTILCIDPAKGGDDFGVVSRNLIEKNFNLLLSLSLLKEIQNHDFHAFLTRSCDYFVSFRKRVEMAQDFGASVFVSLQMQGTDKVCERGMRVVYQNDESKLLAESIIKKVNRRLPLLSQKGIAERSFPILRELKIPSVVIECGYLTNQKDYEIFNQPSNRLLLAWGIREGIESYLSFKKGNQNANQ